MPGSGRDSAFLKKALRLRIAEDRRTSSVNLWPTHMGEGRREGERGVEKGAWTNECGGGRTGLPEKVKPRRSQVYNESVKCSKLAKRTTTARSLR